MTSSPADGTPVDQPAPAAPTDPPVADRRPVTTEHHGRSRTDPYDWLRAKDDPDAVLALAAPGATIVVDDFSADRKRPGPRREGWLAHPRLAAVEMGTGQTARVIVAVVRR